MKSPFSGMDPYIEARGYWRDFHNDLIAEIKRSLAGILPAKYRIRTEEREVIELVEPEGKTQAPRYPDVGVLGPGKNPPASGAAQAAVAEPATGAEPTPLRAFIAEYFREKFLEILTPEPERRLVTCIEVLSPSNKRLHSTTREQYLRKRQALLLGKANLVEIDLLRGGARMPMLDAWPNSPYTMLVGRWYREGVCDVWQVHYNKPLPALRVPLDRPEPDAELELQPLIEAIYQRNRYGEDIDYTKPLDPPLLPAEATWLYEQLRGRSPQS
jgi:hypothetical protein